METRGAGSSLGEPVSLLLNEELQRLVAVWGGGGAGAWWGWRGVLLHGRL